MVGESKEWEETGWCLNVNERLPWRRWAPGELGPAAAGTTTTHPPLANCNKESSLGIHNARNSPPTNQLSTFLLL